MKISTAYKLLSSDLFIIMLTFNNANATLIIVTESKDFTFLSTSVSGNNKVASDSQQVELQGFNSTLGNLVSVNIGLTSDYFFNSNINAKDNIRNDMGIFKGYDASGTSSSTIDLVAELTGGASIGHIMGSDSGSAKCSSRRFTTTWGSSISCSKAERYKGELNDAFNPSMLFVDGFIEHAFSINLTRSITSFLIACDSNDAGDSCSASSNQNAWLGSLSVSYGYEAFEQPSTEVPEPSTFAIFALGLIGLASRRLKNKPTIIL